MQLKYQIADMSLDVILQWRPSLHIYSEKWIVCFFRALPTGTKGEDKAHISTSSSTEYKSFVGCPLTPIDEEGIPSRAVVGMPAGIHPLLRHEFEVVVVRDGRPARHTLRDRRDRRSATSRRGRGSRAGRGSSRRKAPPP